MQSRDYDVILAITVIIATAFLIANLIIEISYTFIDPRVRLGRGGERVSSAVVGLEPEEATRSAAPRAPGASSGDG